MQCGVAAMRFWVASGIQAPTILFVSENSLCIFMSDIINMHRTTWLSITPILDVVLKYKVS